MYNNSLYAILFFGHLLRAVNLKPIGLTGIHTFAIIYINNENY